MTGIGNRNDGQLLAAFAEEGDEAAFAALVERHGKMVQSVCMRVLGEFHEAQDVTQAVFLTLARKAARLRKDSSVGGWLHRVATCLARDVRSAAQSRKRREEKSLQATESVTPAADDMRALREELDCAVEQLPAKYRQPLVLFHLEERSLDDTALALGLKASAASARLVRAREMLRAKLLRRGVAVGSVGALTAMLSAEAGGAVLPASFVSETVKAASLAAAGKLAAGVGTGAVSAKVAAWTKGALNMLFWSQVKTAAVAVAASVVVAAIGAVAAKQTADSNRAAPAIPPASAGVAATPADQGSGTFTPRHGKIVFSTSLPRTEGGIRRLLWTKDSKRILAVVDTGTRFTGNNTRVDPDENDILAVDPATTRSQTLFAKAGVPAPMGSNRLLVQVGGRLLLVEDSGFGARKELPGGEWCSKRVSPDGKYVAYFCGTRDEPHEKIPLRVATADGTVRELMPPAEMKPGPDFTLSRNLWHWDAASRLLFTSVWRPEGTGAKAGDVSYLSYSPATDRFEKILNPLDYPSADTQKSGRKGYGTILLRDGSWLTVSPTAKYTIPPPPPRLRSGANDGKMRGKTPPPAPGSSDPSDRDWTTVENVAEAIEITDPSGKVTRRVQLDRAAIGANQLYAHSVSSGGRYLLASTYSIVDGRVNWVIRPRLIKTLLLDLQDGTSLPKFEVPAKECNLASAHTAVFEAAREVLAVTSQGPVWRLSFDGDMRKTMPDGGNFSIEYRLWVTPFNEYRQDTDRVVVKVRPYDAKAGNTSNSRCAVFWNSAEPIPFFPAAGLVEEPENVVWNPVGDAFAFTAGPALHVWRPER